MNTLQPITASEIQKLGTVTEAAKIKKMADAAVIFYQAQDDLFASQQAKEISLRSARRAGEILLETPKENGARGVGVARPTPTITAYQEALEGAGITEYISKIWQKLARLDRIVFEAYIADAKFSNTEFSVYGLLRFATNAHVSDGSNDWYTPPEYIEAARRVMGKIDLDPASSQCANEIVQADQIYTEEDDGLIQNWQGNVWLNPPYSMPQILYFVKKLLQEYEAGNIQQAVLLVNNATDTGWFHALAEKYIYCMVKGRVGFWHPDPNQQVLGARQGQILFYLGPDTQKFCAEFSKFGLMGAKYDY